MFEVVSEDVHDNNDNWIRKYKLSCIICNVLLIQTLNVIILLTYAKLTPKFESVSYVLNILLRNKIHDKT